MAPSFCPWLDESRLLNNKKGNTSNSVAFFNVTPRLFHKF